MLFKKRGLEEYFGIFLSETWEICLLDKFDIHTFFKTETQHSARRPRRTLLGGVGEGNPTGIQKHIPLPVKPAEGGVSHTAARNRPFMLLNESSGRLHPFLPPTAIDLSRPDCPTAAGSRTVGRRFR